MESHIGVQLNFFVHLEQFRHHCNINYLNNLCCNYSFCFVCGLSCWTHFLFNLMVSLGLFTIFFSDFNVNLKVL